MHENREIPAAPDSWVGPVREGLRSNPDMYAAGKSDIGVVPMKGPNKAGPNAMAEILWHRRETRRITENTNISL